MMSRIKQVMTIINKRKDLIYIITVRDANYIKHTLTSVLTKTAVSKTLY